MKRVLLSLAIVLALATSSQAIELNLLHTNDMHATYAGSHKNGLPCYDVHCEISTGGAIRLQQEVAQQRKTKKNVLFLDAGDHAQGTLFYKFFSTEPTVKVMDVLQYDAMVPGNHEYDSGCKVFYDFSKQIDTPLVAANVRYPKGNPVTPDYKPWIILEREGRKIGIIGLLTPETATLSSPCPEVIFNDPVKVAQEAVKELEAQGVNIIIALTHLGYLEDQTLGKEVTGLDVIVGGHTNTLLSNTHKRAVGPYPTVVSSPSNEPVLVVTTQGLARDLGVLNVSFDDHGKATSWKGDPVPLDTEMPGKPDPTLMSDIDAYTKPLQALLNDKLGFIKAGTLPDDSPLDLDVQLCRTQECVTGNFLTDALLWFGKEQGVQIVFLNGGGARAPLATGMFSVGDILSIMPFDNNVVMADISGKTIKKSLEHGVKMYGQSGGALLQVSGMQYEMDVTRPVGQRFVGAQIRLQDGTWKDIEDDTMYRVLVSDYLANGGDGYEILKTVTWKDTKKIFSDVVQDYMRAMSTLEPQLEKRIVMKDQKN